MESKLVSVDYNLNETTQGIKSLIHNLNKLQMGEPLITTVIEELTGQEGYTLTPRAEQILTIYCSLEHIEQSIYYTNVEELGDALSIVATQVKPKIYEALDAVLLAELGQM